MNILLSGIVGSQAYGLAGPDSDVDRMGLFAAPTEAFHGLHFPRESYGRDKPDETYYEARKFAKLALNGNPTAMELMWLSDYEVCTGLGSNLVTIRTAFLSAKRVREAYLGYATQQFRHLSTTLDWDQDLARVRDHRVAKHARHVARLCWQGYHLYASGELLIRLPETVAGVVWDLGDLVAGGDVGAARSFIAAYEVLFGRCHTPLPDRPDEQKVEQWLHAVRANYLWKEEAND